MQVFPKDIQEHRKFQSVFKGLKNNRYSGVRGLNLKGVQVSLLRSRNQLHHRKSGRMWWQKLPKQSTL
jgi:hypothetical protein